MMVSAPGTALSALPPLPRIPPLAPQETGPLGAGPVSADRVLSILQDLSQADFNRLMRLMDTPVAAQPSGSPQSQETTRQLVAVARLDAEVRLAQAADRVSAGGSTEIPDWDARPDTLLVVASRLFGAGGHANYLRSSQLSQVVINAYGQVAPVVDFNLPIGRSAPRGEPVAPLRAGASATAVLWTGLRTSLRTGMQTKVLPQLRMLSLRAPLLVLLLGWLVLGVAGGIVVRLFRAIAPGWFSSALFGAGFDLWGLGFLLLVCFGFFLRIRKVTF